MNEVAGIVWWVFARETKERETSRSFHFIMASFHRDTQASWQVAQHTTFVRHDPPKDPIEALQPGLKNGVVLTDMLENLSEGKFKAKAVRKPRMKLQMISNLNICFDYLHDLGISLVNVGSVDLYDENYTIDMGLIWSLIHYFQIADQSVSKEDLIAWINSRTVHHNVKVSDFSKSWKDGTAFSALVESFSSNYHFIDDENKMPVERMEGAFTFIDKNLDVPCILEPESVVEFHDEKSILTYLSLIYKEHKDDPNLPCSCPKKEKILCDLGDDSELDGAFVVDCESSLSVQLLKESHKGKRTKFSPNSKDLSATLKAPDGSDVPVSISMDDSGRPSIQFVSTQVGEHLLKIYHKDDLIQTKILHVGIPFIYLQGPGSEFGLVFAPSPFDVIALQKKGGPEMILKEMDERLGFSIQLSKKSKSKDDPSQKLSIPGKTNVAHAHYDAKVAGEHLIQIFWRDVECLHKQVPVFELDLQSFATSHECNMSAPSTGGSYSSGLGVGSILGTGGSSGFGSSLTVVSGESMTDGLTSLFSSCF